MIYHIYWGTSGNSGLYLDEIYQCLKENGYKQKVFVSYYYPFEYGERIFFHHSDIAHCTVKGLKRKFVQLYEILVAFIRIIISARRDKPEVVNYSLISGSYWFVLYFLILLKWVSGSKLIITCHDVCPWGNHEHGSREMKNRQKIFDIADKLLVHNDSSIIDLERVINIDRQKIVKHLFPIMDLTKLMGGKKCVEKKCDFLFIGHLRRDKGIDFLINTWKTFHSHNKEAVLWICGRPQGQDYDVNNLRQYNIICNLGFISDENYCQYIQSARYVILPYLKGTNSGIISTVLSLGADVVTSDISMFTDNPLVSRENMFKSGDADSLVKILKDKYDNQSPKDMEQLLCQYKENFYNEVLSAYKDLTC